MAFSVVRIEGDKPIHQFFRAEGNKEGNNVNGAVGYSAPYALIVHEIHPTKAKFLETPARQYEEEIFEIMSDSYQRRRHLDDAVKKGLNFLKKKSQEVCPVRTGFLQRSAFVIVEKSST